MANTTNFNWETPDDTDLVKDGAAAIRTLGNSIDTSLVDLKGGTTGQVLSKNTNTDMDFVWSTPNVGDITEVQAGTGISVASGTGPIPVVTNTVATAFDAKGDLIAGTGADTFSKIAVGSNGQILTADSTTATGLKWAAAASSSALTYVGGATFTTASSQSLDNVFTSTYENYLIFLNITSISTVGQIRLRLRASGADDTSANYYTVVDFVQINGTGGGTTKSSAQAEFRLNDIGNMMQVFHLSNPQIAQNTILGSMRYAFNYQTDFYTGGSAGLFNGTTAFDGITVYPAGGTITGKIRVYGVANS